MNKIYQLKWSRSRHCWCVCSELGSRIKGKKAKAILFGIISLFSSMALANNVTINKDETVEFGSANQTVDYHITVTNNANLVINATDSSRYRLTLASGGGLDITQGKVHINGPLNVLLKGTGFLNVANAGSELYADDLYDSQSNIRHDQGYFNVSNGGKIHVKGTSRLTYQEGNISGKGSQVNTGTFFMGVSGSSGGDQFLSVNNEGEINAQERLSLGYFDQRSNTTLVVSEGGKISASEINLSTKSELALGAQEGKAAKAAGIIDADKIEFVWASTSDKKITLNHTDDNAVIAADIASGSEGLGYINAINGTTFLTGNNSAFSGEVKISKNAVLGVTQNLGTANITNSGKLQLNAGEDMLFGNNISGNGTIAVGSGAVTLSGDNTSLRGNIDIASDAAAYITDQKNIGSAALNIDGKLQLNTTKDWVFSNVVSGTGILGINTGNHTFSFKDGVNSGKFSGSLELQDTVFNLKDNAAVMSGAGLIAGNGSHISVGTGTQSLNSLAFSGGTLDFGTLNAGTQQTDSTVQVSDSLDLRGDGAVQISDTGVVDTVSRNIDTSMSLTELDDGNNTIQLVSANGATVLGDAANLQLLDQNGQKISSGEQGDINQNGQKVAIGSYDYRLTSGANNDGLYIGYGLTRLDLLTSGNDALVLSANNKSGNAADLSAQISGNGDLAFNSQKGQTVSLSNRDNDYTGITDVRSGNLLFNNDNVLGNTSELRLAAETALDMNGHSQTIGKLSGAADSQLNINGGSLTLTDGGTSAGTLTGDGTLNIHGGTLEIVGENRTLTAKTNIAKGASVQMGNLLGLGAGDINTAGTLSLNEASGVLSNNLSGDGVVALSRSDTLLAGNNSHFSGQFTLDSDSQLIASDAENLGSASVENNGTLILHNSADWQLRNSISGTGSVCKMGAGTLTVGNNMSWRGQTDIKEGALALGSATESVTLASQQVNIAQQGKLSGFGGVAGSIDNAGLLQVGDGKSASPSQFTVDGNLTNSGEMATGITGQQAGNKLIVNGNYSGDNGRLVLNTALNGDDSTTDKLIVQGDTSGTTFVSVNNAGGSGAKTLNGIELIHVGGQSDGEFIQDGRIVAGAYDYTLERGLGANSGNWYLTSGQNTADPQPKPEGMSGNDLRPEAGSYTANLAAANTLFATRLHDRLGKMQYTDAVTGEQKKTTMWMRHEGSHNNWRDGSGQLKTQSNRYVLQLGGDIAQWSQNGGDRWHLGVMAGYGNNHSNTVSSQTHYRSKGRVNGYSAGMYATWFADNESHNGAYLDSWAQYNWFNNHVKGDELQAESYKSKGFTASLEAGYSQKLAEFTGSKGTLNQWFVQPQAQVTWMGVKAENHRENNGTRVSSEGHGNIQTRLGVKTWLKSHHKMDEGKSREFQPFMEVNWLHNSKAFTTHLDGVSVHQDGSRNIAEVKAGVEGQINSHLNAWGHVGVQLGDQGYNNTSAMIGVKWQF